MKLLTAFCFLPLAASAVIVTGPIRDVGDAAINAVITFVPLDTPLQESNGVVYIDWTKKADITNGVITPTVLVGGRYDCQIASSKTFRAYAPPGDTNTYTIAQLATLATNVPSLVFHPLYNTNYTVSTTYIVNTNIPSYVIPGQYMRFTTNAAGTIITNAVDDSALSGSSYFQGAFAPLNSVMVLARGEIRLTNGVARVDAGIVISQTQPIVLGYNALSTTNLFRTIGYYVSNAVPTQFFFIKSTSGSDNNRVAWAVLKP